MDIGNIKSQIKINMKYKLSDILKEISFNKIFHLEGILIMDHNKRNQKDVLSDP